MVDVKTCSVELGSWIFFNYYYYLLLYLINSIISLLLSLPCYSAITAFMAYCYFTMIFIILHMKNLSQGVH